MKFECMHVNMFYVIYGRTGEAGILSFQFCKLVREREGRAGGGGGGGGGREREGECVCVCMCMCPHMSARAQVCVCVHVHFLSKEVSVDSGLK